MKSSISLLVMTLALAACATQDSSRLSSAATTPLSDLNLVQATIPPVLEDARKLPYRPPADSSCQSLSSDIRALDEALGPDLDAPASEANPGLLERGGDLAAGALKSAAEGVVPFRGWVRKLSGAERYARDVAASIAAGSVRRAFLKGLRAAQRC